MNSIVKVTKIFTFEMAHALLNYDGDCKNIHGHSYKLYVTVKGEPLQEPGHPKDGMLLDFKLLKALVKKMILTPFDHALVLHKNTPEETISILQKGYAKVVLFPIQPTCENLILDFAQRLKEGLPPKVELSQLKLYETATSYTEWENN